MTTPAERPVLYALPANCCRTWNDAKTYLPISVFGYGESCATIPRQTQPAVPSSGNCRLNSWQHGKSLNSSRAT